MNSGAAIKRMNSHKGTALSRVRERHYSGQQEAPPNPVSWSYFFIAS